VRILKAISKPNFSDNKSNKISTSNDWKRKTANIMLRPYSHQTF
jgi:hypothetical protein